MFKAYITPTVLMDFFLKKSANLVQPFVFSIDIFSLHVYPPVQKVEDELEGVGENMKVLEKSSEKAMEREEKLIDKILQFQQKFKAAEAR